MPFAVAGADGFFATVIGNAVSWGQHCPALSVAPIYWSAGTRNLRAGPALKYRGHTNLNARAVRLPRTRYRV